MVNQAIEILEKINPQRFKVSLKVKDGSYKYIESVDKNQDENIRASQIETVYSGGLLRKLVRTIKGDFSSEKESVENFPIQNVNLFFEQGKTYLVLGGPGSGKSSLLKMIAGILPEDKRHFTKGTVQVNKCVTPQTKDIVWSNIVGYIDQIDRLHPYLTVKETCDFAWLCRNGGTHRSPLHDTGPEADEQIKKMDEEEWLVTTVLESMGLTRVKNTFVGDQETVRGVSGGEKKRVTVSEMSVGRFPILCMDEISTGLDGR